MYFEKVAYFEKDFAKLAFSVVKFVKNMVQRKSGMTTVSVESKIFPHPTHAKSHVQAKVKT